MRQIKREGGVRRVRRGDKQRDRESVSSQTPTGGSISSHCNKTGIAK